MQLTTSSPIQITPSDHARLTLLIEDLRPARGPLPRHLQFLEEELNRARLTDPADLPADVITLHSRARIVESDSGDVLEYTLAFPDDADISAGKISILSPLGTAMLGYRAGDTFAWPTPDGATCLARVEEVLFQPEENLRRQPTE